MSFRKLTVMLFCVIPMLFVSLSLARGGVNFNKVCRTDLSFVEFQSIDLEQTPPVPLTVKGKLKIPFLKHRSKWRKLPAVVILHGSSGVDFRGDFYARALNAAGIATLEIDMWEARKITTTADRPPFPLFTYPDAFGALAFLAEHPKIDPERIGVLGFSWGGVIAMAAATNIYASQFGNGRHFAAHVAHYPVCYTYNSQYPGTDFYDLTGAPILIQIGDEDGYDNGCEPCFALRDSLDMDEKKLVKIVVYENAYHAWDRLEVPVTIEDPFSNLGAGGTVGLIPDVDCAYESRRRAVGFFLNTL